MCWAIIGPASQIHRLCVVAGPRVLQPLNFVGPKPGKCQHANNDVLPITPTIAHVGPTIACYLGLSCLEVPCHPLADLQDIPGYVSTTLYKVQHNIQWDI